MSDNSRSDQDALDLLWGVRDIARTVGLTDRQTFYLLQHGHLPAQKVGQRWVASRSGLQAFFTAAGRGEVASEDSIPA